MDTAGKRLDVYDKIKGFAIILVVMGHITQYALGVDGTLFNRLYGAVHVPLFFFVGGYFAVRNSSKPLFSFICSKGIHLIVPTIVWGGLWFIFKGKGDITSFDAYWFLPVLFYCLIVVRLIQLKTKTTTGVIIGGIICWGIIALLYKSSFVSVPFLLNFLLNFPIFLFGIFFHDHEGRLSSDLSYTVSLIFFTLLILVNNEAINKIKLAGFFACVIVCLLFKKYDKKIPNIFSTFGRNSLEIYVTHYFLIPNLMLSTNVVLLINDNVISSLNICVLALVTSALAIFICFTSLLISKVIKESRILSFLFYGKKKEG
mgnify:FL=1